MNQALILSLEIMNKIIPTAIRFGFTVLISSLITTSNQNLSPIQNKLETDGKLPSVDATGGERSSKICQQKLKNDPNFNFAPKSCISLPLQQ